MRLTGMALSNLARRPLRTTLTALGIAVAVGSFIIMVGLSQGIERAWTTNFEARKTQLMAFQKGAVELLTTSVDAALGEQIARVPGVASVAGELGDLMSLEDRHTAVAVGWPAGCHLWDSLQMVEGRFPAAGETAALLGQGAAKALGKKTGDRILLRNRSFVLSGIFRMDGVMGNNALILLLGTMQNLTQRPGKVTGFHIRLAAPGDAAATASIREKLEAAFPDLVFLETRTAADHDLVLKLFRAVAWSISLIALVIAFIIVLNTLLMSVAERTHEIGILAAVGWTSGRIGGLMVWEGVMLASAGGAAGLILGVAGLHGLTMVPRVQGLIEPAWSFNLLAQAGGAVLVLGVLGSLIPAVRSSRPDPVTALRHE